MRDLHSPFSVVIAGPLKSRIGSTGTDPYLRHLREAFPSSELILSTWAGELEGQPNDRIQVLENADPGEDWVPDSSPQARNYSRMVASSAAGLDLADRPYVIKARCEIAFPAGVEKRLLERIRRSGPDPLLVSNWWSLRCNDLPILHVSDILHIGSASKVRAVWDSARQLRVPALTQRSRTNPAANEQLLWSSFMNFTGMSSRIISDRDDSSDEVRRAWRSLLREEVELLRPENLGITSPWSEIDARFAPDRYLRGIRLPMDSVIDVGMPLARTLKNAIRKR